LIIRLDDLFNLCKYFIFILLIFSSLHINYTYAESPDNDNILKLIKNKLAKWNSIQYTMDININEEPYGYKVFYRRPSTLTTVSWNKNDNTDKVTMIVSKNTTTVFDHKQNDKQTFDTGAFDLFRVNNEYDTGWIVEYLGKFDLSCTNSGKKEKRATWVVTFTTQQGIEYRFWIDQYTGINLRMEVRLKKGEKPYVVAKITSFKLDKPVDKAVFKDPF